MGVLLDVHVRQDADERRADIDPVLAGQPDEPIEIR